MKRLLRALALLMLLSGIACAEDISSPRFVPLAIYLDTPVAVAAWQFELKNRNGVMKVVGVENGGHPAFPRTPYYDREAVARDDVERIVVADYSLADENTLPIGRVRLATLHLMLAGEPDFDLRLITATTREGESVNRYLMERMAKVGRGAVAYLGLNDSAEEVMGAFFERVSRAALTDVDIAWGGMTVSDTYPDKLPDLFVGRPLVVSGKFRGKPASVTVAGTVDGARRPFVVEATDAGSGGASLAKVWARAYIAELSDRLATTGDPQGALGATIKHIALQYQLASDYTSFVAVDSSATTEGDYGVTVHQAVPVPEGVRYETTVAE